METIHERYPCRRKQIDQLCNFYKEQPFPDTIFLHGCSGTGKSTIISTIFHELNVKYVTINLIECYTSRILFESILNQLAPIKVNLLRQPSPCYNLAEFIDKLQTIEDVNETVIVLDKAEELRNMDFNILPAFVKLREISQLNVTVVLISEIIYEKFLHKSEYEVIRIHFPQYNMNEFAEILLLDFPNVKSLIERTYPNVEITRDFYNGYLKIFLGVFYRACRDLPELRRMCRINFLEYCSPIARNECDVDNVSQLWRHISPLLKSSLESLYMPVVKKGEVTNASFIKEKLAHTLELPFYSKYLLMAAYLASYNPSKEDKHLFLKQGKKRKTIRDVKAKNKVSEKLNTQLGPKSFPFERLIAIFYAILDEKVDLNSRLLALIATLVERQLLEIVSGDSELEGRKYKCCTGFEFIEMIAHNLDFNIKKYLVDFN